MRRLWPRVVKWWDQAKEGGAILAHPRKYFLRVFPPSLLAWLASLGVMAVFLAAYEIPVSFDTLMRICGGNSIANVTSVTPGGAGVKQAFNVASLNGNREPHRRDRLLGRAAAGHDRLEHHLRDRPDGLGVRLDRRQGARPRSYVEAKEKTAEQKAARAARRDAKRAERNEMPIGSI